MSKLFLWIVCHNLQGIKWAGKNTELLEATTEKHRQSDVLVVFFFNFVLFCFISSKHHYTKLFYPKHKTNPKKSHIMCEETVAYKWIFTFLSFFFFHSFIYSKVKFPTVLCILNSLFCGPEFYLQRVNRGNVL